MTVRLLLGLFGLISLSGAAEPALFKPKVVVVTMFEIDGGPGGPPGELRFWIEREHLDRIIPLPAALHDLHANADGSVVAILTGVGNTNAAASIMALALDPRFDLRQTYWLVAGIAAIDGKVDARRVFVPHTASDFDMQWPGTTAAEALKGDEHGLYPAFLPSLEAAYRVGSRVVHALVAD